MLELAVTDNGAKNNVALTTRETAVYSIGKCLTLATVFPRKKISKVLGKFGVLPINDRPDQAGTQGDRAIER
jgi:hypothetical protein